MNSGILIKTLERSFLETGDVVAYYSFASSNANKIVFNDFYSTGQNYIDGNTGKLRAEVNPAISIGSTNNPTSGAYYGGSGYFNYSDLLQVGTGIELEDWTVFVNYLQEAPPSSNAASVLFSTMKSGNDNSGFTVGLNAANKIFFDYIDERGIRNTHTFTGTLTNFNNLVSVSQQGGDLEIIHHDIINHVNDLQLFDISGIKTSSSWRIGGFSSYTPAYTGFNGYMDDVLIFSGGYTALSKDLISEAFFSTGVESGHTQSIIKYYNEITGLSVNPTGVTGTGITGYTEVLVETINGVEIYEPSGLTGEITGIISTYLTGALTVSGSGELEVTGYTLYDYDYINKYADNSLVFNKKLSPSSKYEVYSYDQSTTNLNNDLEYDFTATNFLIKTGDTGSLPLKNINVYMNGRAIYSGSGFSIVEEMEVKFTGDFTVTDSGVYNSISGSQAATPFTGKEGIITLSDSKFLNKDAYLDGVKLISGDTWSGVSSTVKIDASALNSGTFFFLPRHSESVNRATGIASNFINFNFKLVDEQVWLNGLKQKHGIDYFKTSNYSLLNSNNYLTGFSEQIVDNPTGFFNV